MLSFTRMELEFFGSEITFNWWPSGRVLACQVSFWGSRPVDPIVLLVARPTASWLFSMRSYCSIVKWGCLLGMGSIGFITGGD